MRIVNVVVLLISLGAVVHTARLFAKDRAAIRTTVMWIVIWSAIGVFGMFPDLIDVLMVQASMQNRLFFVLMVAVLILYAMQLRQSSENADHARRINRVAQNLALLRYDVEHGALRRDDPVGPREADPDDERRDAPDDRVG